MASIGTEGVNKRILFVDTDGKRKTLRLGKVSIRQAAGVKIKVEALLAAKLTGQSPDEEVSKWVDDRDDAFHAQLAAVGLVKPRIGQRATLGAFIDAFIANRSDAKPHTVLNMQQVRRWLVAHFGENADMRGITSGGAEDWRAYMLANGLGENTVRRHIGRARQLFKSAIRRGVVRGQNPFEGMAATVRSDKARMFYVTREMADKVTAACPDAQWRLLFALSRYGGLRCPSEHLALKWSDIDWEHNRIRVPSPKTEHHEGHDCRIIPMFPELRKPLMDVLAENEFAAAAGEPVIARYRDAYGNLRTQFIRIIRKAGLAVWPKPWHNLRATRQTELAERYPIHVVCQWIGNSRAVAMEHYLSTTDAHFAQAVAGNDPAQNPAQYAAVSDSNEPQSKNGTEPGALVLQAITDTYETVQDGQYPRQDSNL